MFIVAVNVYVMPEFVEPFKEAILDNARNTRTEPGNVRFDVLQHAEDPTQFFLYEAYHTRDGFAAHQETEHYLRWKNKVTDWMAKPRQAAKHNSLFFGDGEE